MTFEELALSRIQRQFGYTNISELIIKKGEIWNKFSNLADKFGKEIIDFNNCISGVLDSIWGNIFKITRNFEIDGTSYSLTDDQFREIIKIKAFGTTWDGALASMNAFLHELFRGRGNAFIIDVQNMSALLFLSDFTLENWEKAILPRVLPRPAGVGYEIEFDVITKKYFGYGTFTEIQPSPITVGFGTYEGDPMGSGNFATYNEEDE